MHTAPDLQGIKYHIPLLQIFTKRVRAGLLSAHVKPSNKLSVEQYLRSIGQIFASLETNDPHHNCMGKLDFRLGRQLASYQKEDSPPERVRPLPVNVIQALDTAS